MQVYLSGPITGTKNYEKNFSIAERYFSERGHRVTNPVRIGKLLEELHEGQEPSWSEYMKEDVKALADCDAIAMLPGWNDSRGARLERQVADALGLLETRVPAYLYGTQEVE